MARELGVGVEAFDRADLGQDLRRGDRSAAGQLEERWSRLRCPLFELAVELDDRAGERAAAHDKFPSDPHLYLCWPAGKPAADAIKMHRSVEALRGDDQGRVELVQMPAQPLLDSPSFVDEIIAMVDQQLQVPKQLLARARTTQARLSQGRSGDREGIDRVGRWLARRSPEVQVRVARELVVRCRSLTRTIVELDRELEQRTAQTAPALLELPGCGAITAAKLLAEIRPIDRFQTDAQLARHSGVAPLQASSGRVQRHRLDRGGNRQLNCALYRIAITQARYHPPARAYLERKQTEGKSRREAIRCLKRILIRTVFNTLKASPTLT